MFVRAPGLYEWPRILAMCIFSIPFNVFLYSHTVQNKRCFVVVACSFRARQPPPPSDLVTLQSHAPASL